jgi:hypothetical protein
MHIDYRPSPAGLARIYPTGKRQIGSARQKGDRGGEVGDDAFALSAFAATAENLVGLRLRSEVERSLTIF